MTPAIAPVAPPLTPGMKLFVLRIQNSNSVLANYSTFLWKELDRGWNIDSYEVILTDPAAMLSDVLIRMSSRADVSALPPPSPVKPPLPAPTKLFALRVMKTNAGYVCNTGDLWVELDRGFSIDSYKVIMADPAGQVCDVLITLNNNAGAAAVPPAQPFPDPPLPAQEKLLVVSPYFASTVEGMHHMKTLWSEIDRGWKIDSYCVVLRSDAGGIYYLLVKLTNAGPTGKITAITKDRVFSTDNTAGISMGQWVTVDGTSAADGASRVIALAGSSFTLDGAPLAGDLPAGGTWRANVSAVAPSTTTVLQGFISHVTSDAAAKTLIVTTGSTQGLFIGATLLIQNTDEVEFNNLIWTITALSKTEITMDADTKITVDMPSEGQWLVVTGS